MEQKIEDFNPLVFEKKLVDLKDTQESIQGMSAWCLQRKAHHKKIVASWLNVLKRVKVEQRLALFYLANDVIQYSKRKNYDFVKSWGTTLQKATPLVRDDKVKHKILRIFKIWEQRSVYDEEFLTDLTGLLSAAAGKKTSDDDPNDFQPLQLVNKIRQCSVLETDTDLRLQNIHECTLDISDTNTLCATLKERRDMEEVEKELDASATCVELYAAALQREILARETLCALLQAAHSHYATQRGEVKVVANAYRNFGTRVRCLKRKLDELITTLPVKEIEDEVVSPPIAEDVPSPEPDEDVQLPGVTNSLEHEPDSPQEGIAYNIDKTFNTTLSGDTSLYNAGFSSFLGADNPFSFFQDTIDGDNAGNKIEVISGRPVKAEADFNINDFLKNLLPNSDNYETSPTDNDGTFSLSSTTSLGDTLPGLDLLTPDSGVLETPAPVPAPLLSHAPLTLKSPHTPLLPSIPPAPPAPHPFYNNDNHALKNLSLDMFAPENYVLTEALLPPPPISFYGSNETASIEEPVHTSNVYSSDTHSTASWPAPGWEVSMPSLGSTPPPLRPLPGATLLPTPMPVAPPVPQLAPLAPPPPHFDTPESPPMGERRANEGIPTFTTRDTHQRRFSQELIGDVDHRSVLKPPPPPPMIPHLLADLEDIDQRVLPPLETRRPQPKADVDHRNLISLTTPQGDDRHSVMSTDQDYRSRVASNRHHEPTDIVESVDMDLSEDDDLQNLQDMLYPNHIIPPPTMANTQTSSRFAQPPPGYPFTPNNQEDPRSTNTKTIFNNNKILVGRNNNTNVNRNLIRINSVPIDEKKDDFKSKMGPPSAPPQLFPEKSEEITEYKPLSNPFENMPDNFMTMSFNNETPESEEEKPLIDMDQIEEEIRKMNEFDEPSSKIDDAFKDAMEIASLNQTDNGLVKDVMFRNASPPNQGNNPEDAWNKRNDGENAWNVASPANRGYFRPNVAQRQQFHQQRMQFRSPGFIPRQEMWGQHRPRSPMRPWGHPRGQRPPRGGYW